MEVEQLSRPNLGPSAYEAPATGEEYQPLVPAQFSGAEFTIKAILAGIAFGILFGAANAYLGLRVGLTISTSIPVAVLTVALFKALEVGGVRSTLLEANLSQTVGSASSSVASGVIFTLPALYLWGFDPSLLQMTLLALAGGLLGVLFMVPLRRLLIAREHGNLPYPEGTACAEVLVASRTGGNKAKNVFIGLGVGALVKFVVGAMHALPDKITVQIPFLKKGEVATEVSAALLGVGYILGLRIATVMVGGALLSWVVLIPAIAYYGEGLTAPMYPETVNLIRDMSPSQIWTRYIRYIGAGAVATAGIITLLRSIPTMLESFRVGTSEFKTRVATSNITAEKVLRTKHDLPLKYVGAGALIIATTLFAVPQIFGIPDAGFRLVASVLVVIFAFVFVTVSSRIVGLVGVTSNPTSGMTIATLLGTAGLFLLFGWTDDLGKASALAVGCVVAIAASIAGDTSQDLKTGYLLGATPYRQQRGELIGVLTCAFFVVATLVLVGDTWGFGTEEIPAPQAVLMQLVIDGVLDQSLPWGLVAIGVGIALIIELFRIPSLAFAVGVYLPVATMLPLFFGGLLRWKLERDAPSQEVRESRREKGVLFGSGLVGGEGLFGVLIAGYAAYTAAAPEGIGYAWAGRAAPFLAGLFFLGLIAYFWRLATKDG